MVVPASSSRRRRRRSAATATASLLTAAAALQLATSTTEAFVTPGSGAACARCAVGSSSSSGSSCRTGSTSAVGPLHARAVAARARALTSSLPPESVTCNRAVAAQLANYNFNSNSVNGGIFNFHPPPLVGSTVVPPTALLSPRRAPSILVPGAASKYGGRASGSPSPTGCAGDDGRASLVNSSSRGSLGFVVVVDDVPSAPSSSSPARTSLAVSRSVPDQADQMDASSFFGGDHDGDEIEIGIVAADDAAAAASPVRRQVAESLRRNAASSNSKVAAAETSSSSPSSTVPAWFPWIPTRSQIETLKVPELRDACGERGLTKVRYERYTRNTDRNVMMVPDMYRLGICISLKPCVCMFFSACHFVR